MHDIINSEYSKCCPLALTKACLLHWSIALLTVVFSKSARTSTMQSLLLGHVTYTGFCVLLYAAPSLIRNSVKVRSDWQQQIR